MISLAVEPAGRHVQLAQDRNNVKTAVESFITTMEFVPNVQHSVRHVQIMICARAVFLTAMPKETFNASHATK